MSTRDRTPWRRFILAALAVVAIGLTGCAQTPPRPETSGAAGGDPDQLLAAASRAWALERDFQTALRLAGQATAAAPDRADAAWLHLRLCDASPQCQTPTLEAKLKRLAPNNGVVWLSALRRAQMQRDERAEVPILEALSHAKEFSLYWTTLVPKLTTAVQSASPARTGKEASAPLTAALNDATGWLASLSLPAFAPLNQACSPERLQDANRRDVCRRIAQVLKRSDTYIAEGVGLGVAQRIAAPGSAEANEIERQIDTLSYRNSAAASIAAAQLERDKFSAEVLELMQQLPREQDVSLAILRWASQPLNP